MRPQLGRFKNSDGPSDRASDHRPMLCVHSRTVRHPVGRSVASSDGPSLLVPPPPAGALAGLFGVGLGSRY